MGRAMQQPQRTLAAPRRARSRYVLLAAGMGAGSRAVRAIRAKQPLALSARRLFAEHHAAGATVIQFKEQHVACCAPWVGHAVAK